MLSAFGPKELRATFYVTFRRTPSSRLTRSYCHARFCSAVGHLCPAPSRGMVIARYSPAHSEIGGHYLPQVKLDRNPPHWLLEFFFSVSRIRSAAAALGWQTSPPVHYAWEWVRQLPLFCCYQDGSMLFEMHSIELPGESKTACGRMDCLLLIARGNSAQCPSMSHHATSA